jgi:hypothetical protein
VDNVLVQIPPPSAPTENLNLIARGTALATKSVSAVVKVPAHLNLTNVIDVKVKFGGAQLPSQKYDNANGNRFAYDFQPGNGARRWENVTIDYTEHKGRKKIPWQVVSSLNIEPLYTVVVSGVSFKLLSDCDWVGDSEPYLQWLDPTGHAGDDHYRDLGSMSKGSTVNVPAGVFGGVFSDVSAAMNLQVPGTAWGEHDPAIFNPEVIYPHAQETHVAIPLGDTYTADYNQGAYNEDCSAHLHFTTASQVQLTPGL